MHINKTEVIALYKRYGFEVINTNDEYIIVCIINNGHYYNADIVILNNTSNAEKIFTEYTKTGYACKIREYMSIKDVSETLFKGFFSVENSKERLKKSYTKFTNSLVSSFSKNSKYSYINSNYFINGETGRLDVVSEITNRLSDLKPTLFLIEAAAGFGKTCTAYELLNNLIKKKNNGLLPLFTELSRNRQAKIFRYVLLDEIDNFFPTLSSKLVRLEIKDGKVPVILDGFDELLHTKLDDNDEINETMIETIGELLEGKAKIILTTRRTAMFDGDEFHEWMNAHKDDFSMVRIKIDEPTLDHWLEESRIELLKKNDFSIEKLSNPVLLSFLRSISDLEFCKVATEPNMIVNKYFELMLDREKTRQDLNMSVEEQYSVFTRLAKDMIDLSYTSESREYFISCFLEYEQQLLEEVRSRYAVESKPTKDELANKLASHALLDKSNIDNKGVGFINEFVLGNFCAENIINSTDDYMVEDTRFIAPAVISYIPRSSEQKLLLWNSLAFVLDFINISEKIKYMISLNSKIISNIQDSTIENLIIKDIKFGEEYKLSNSLFINCTFTNSDIDCRNINEVSFVDCNFYNSNISNYQGSSSITLLGCNSDNNIESEINEYTEIKEETSDDKEKDCELFILNKFWNKGRDTFYKHRHIKGLYTGNSTYSHKDILQGLDRLRKKEFLLQPDKVNFAEFNTAKIAEIKSYMERK